MGVSEDFLEGVLRELHDVGEIEARRMFGGYGLYVEGLFFGLCAEDRLFFKVDEAGARDCVMRGIEPFDPRGDGKGSGKYFEVPATVLADAAGKTHWFERAVSEARKARSQRKPRSRGLSGLRNIGPVSRRWLVAVGVQSRADLEERGAVEIWKAVRALEPGASLNLLYALEGARLDRRWSDLSLAERESLKQRAGIGS